MTDFLFDIGYVTNLAVIILVLGWLSVGLMLGYIIGSDRAERRSHAREDAARDYWRSYYAHPSNRI